MSGTLNLHGNRTHTWTKLAQTAAAGSSSIQVLDASGWRVGDEIVLASTDFDRPALSTALQEQLGLRVASGRAPVDMLVIGRAERPAED